MKKLLSMTAGIALLLAFGYAFHDKASVAGTLGKSDQMITNEDLPTVTPDQEGSTFNQMPGNRAEGSAAGGMRSGSDTWKKKADKPEKGAIDKPATEPDREKQDTGGYDTGTYQMPGY